MCYIISLALIVGGYFFWVLGSAMERIGDEMIQKTEEAEKDNPNK